MSTYHTIFIGGGINNLVAASLLSKKGKKVLVLERTEFLGGCIRSEQAEGCVIDTLSTAYPLFVTSPVFAQLKDDLAKAGAEFVATDTPTASILSNKKYALIKTNAQANEAHFNTLSDGDGKRFREVMNWVGANAEVLFTFLGQELISKSMTTFLGKHIWKSGTKKLLDDFGTYVKNVRNDLPIYFKSPEVQATLAPWVLHTGLSPDSLFSSTMAKIVAFTLELVGLPLVKGGSYKIVDAFKSIIEKNGGQTQLGADVYEILVDSRGTVKGVKTADGKTYDSQFVVASVTPTQLYGSLIKDKKHIPQEVQTDAQNFKYGMGDMQIHLILKDAPQWFDNNLNKVTYVHLTDGINNIAQAVAQAKAQLLPEQCTIAVGQPTAADPSRATGGKHVLWIQLPECPNFPAGDAAGKLNNLCKGEWTEELKNAYADRIIDRIGNYISNVKSACVYKKIVSPKDLSELNINLVNGDPYGGLCEMEQYMMFRPLKSTKNHTTPIKNLYHSGASTHPGPGLGGGAGFLVAQQLLKK